MWIASLSSSLSVVIIPNGVGELVRVLVLLNKWRSPCVVHIMLREFLDLLRWHWISTSADDAVEIGKTACVRKVFILNLDKASVHLGLVFGAMISAFSLRLILRPTYLAKLLSR